MISRRDSIINYLISENQYVPVATIADKFSVSRKTIYRDLDEIDLLLANYDGRLARKRGQGIMILIDPRGRDLLVDDLGIRTRSSDDNLKLQLIIGILFLTSDGVVSLSDVARALNISKSLADQQLRVWRKGLSPEIQVVGTSKGYRIVSGGQQGRSSLINYLASYLDRSFDLLDLVSLKKKDGQLIKTPLLTREDLEFVDQKISRIESYFDNRFTRQEANLLSACIYLIITGSQNLEGDQLLDRSSCGLIYDLALRLCSDIEASYAHDLSPEAPVLLANVMASINTLNQSVKSNRSLVRGFGVGRKFAEDFIDAFSTITEIDLRGNNYFYESIVAHISLMIDRVLLGIEIANSNVTFYVQEFRETMNTCVVICWILSRKYNISDIPKTEIAYLMLYIQSQIMDAGNKKIVCFISRSDRPVLSFYSAKIKEAFPDWNLIFADHITYEQFIQDEAAFVITTDLSLVSNRIPYINVSSRLNNDDLNRIKEFDRQLSVDYRDITVKLNNTVRDLKDLGCRTSISRLELEGELEPGDNLVLLTSTNVEFLYSKTLAKESSLKFVLSGNLLKRVYLNMKNWDFMLFASKLLFLIENLPSPIKFDKKMYFYYKEDTCLKS